MLANHTNKGAKSYLESQDLGLDELERTSVDLDETAASLEISHHVSLTGSIIVCRLDLGFANLAVGNGGGGLLLAKALDGVAGRHDCGCRDAGG